jgi:sulfur carrier protein ThiS
MKIQVKVATILMSKAVPPVEAQSFELEVPEDTDVEALIRMLGIPRRLVGSVTVNKRRCGTDRVLDSGDSVAIIPAISGG